MISCNASARLLTGWPKGLFVALIGFFTGCAEIPSPPEVNYPQVRIAARNAAYTVAEQLKQAGLHSGEIWVSPAINRHSGEITASGREFQIMMALDLKTLLSETIVQSVGGKDSASLSWILAPSVVFEKPTEENFDTNWFKVDIALVSPGGKRLPGVSLRINAQQFDATPSRFFQDAPLYLTGTYQEARQEFSQGSKSATSTTSRNRFIALEGLIQEAILQFEQGKYTEAAQGFSAVLDKDPENLPALSGRYQVLIETEKKTDAKLALDRLIEAALSQGNISFKFMFQVRSTEFRDDLNITRHYSSWLKQLANKVDVSERCIQVLGHASRSGSFEFNKQLSQDRAQRVIAIMLKHSPGLKGRIKAEGRGYSENVVGSGKDDFTDAIDRRVDFNLTPCQ